MTELNNPLNLCCIHYSDLSNLRIALVNKLVYENNQPTTNEQTPEPN